MRGSEAFAAHRRAGGGGESATDWCGGVCTGKWGTPVFVSSSRPDLEMRGAAVGSGAGIQPLDPSGS